MQDLGAIFKVNYDFVRQIALEEIWCQVRVKELVYDACTPRERLCNSALQQPPHTSRTG